MAKDRSKITGIKAVAEMMNQMDPKNRDRIMAELARKDPGIAIKVRKEMFVFEDLAKMINPKFQQLLRKVSQPDLLLALRTTSQEMKEKVFTNLSKRAANILKQEMAEQKPQKRSDVEAAQQRIIAKAREIRD